MLSTLKKLKDMKNNESKLKHNLELSFGSSKQSTSKEKKLKSTSIGEI